jgi:hypothetical protein
MVQELKWHKLSEEGKRFVLAFGQNEKAVNYIEDTKDKTIIVLKNKNRLIFNWKDIHLSAK